MKREALSLLAAILLVELTYMVIVMYTRNVAKKMAYQKITMQSLEKC